MLHAWEVREWRHEARFAKLMFLVAKVAGAKSLELEDFLPPHPDDKEESATLHNRGQQALAAYLKSHVGLPVQTQRDR